MRALVLIALVLAGCPAFPDLHSNIDAGVGGSAGVASVCARACANLVKLKCAGYRGSPGDDGVYGTLDDVSCTQVCKDFETAAHQVPNASLHPDCLAAAKSCLAVERCSQ